MDWVNWTVIPGRLLLFSLNCSQNINLVLLVVKLLKTVSVTELPVTFWSISSLLSQFSAFNRRFSRCQYFSFKKGNFTNCLQMSLENMIWYQIVDWFNISTFFQLMILTRGRRETSTKCWCANDLTSNHVFQWHSKTICEISILKGAILTSRKTSVGKRWIVKVVVELIIDLVLAMIPIVIVMINHLRVFWHCITIEVHTYTFHIFLC